MDANPPQVAVDPSSVIRHQQAVNGALINQLASDLAITRALLDDAKTENERLTRVNEALTQQIDPQQAATDPQ